MIQCKAEYLRKNGANKYAAIHLFAAISDDGIKDDVILPPKFFSGGAT